MAVWGAEVALVVLLPLPEMEIVAGACLHSVFQKETLGGNAGVGESLSPGRGARAGGDIPRD